MTKEEEVILKQLSVIHAMMSVIFYMMAPDETQYHEMAKDAEKAADEMFNDWKKHLDSTF